MDIREHKFVQPDPYTCSPTALAYLLYKTKDTDFDETLKNLIRGSYNQFDDIKENGISLDQLLEIAKPLGIECNTSDEKPDSIAYLTTVTKLPNQDFELNDFIKRAVKESSLRIEKDYYVYPYGHTVSVFEDGKGKAIVFDALFGKEMTILLSELERCLERPISFLTL